MKKIGYIGLGKMGKNMVLRLNDKKWDVIAYSRSHGAYKELNEIGIKTSDSIIELIESLETPRILWLMVPNQAVEGLFEDIINYLSPEDTIIDGGNSFYKDSIKRTNVADSRGINYLDVGVSGGPEGARAGACVMVGGKQSVYSNVKELFEDISAPNAYGYMGKSGSGHFVKMIHNGIEYGMMQAIGEGFEIMKKSDFDLNLEDVSRIYNHSSVIESRLVGWLQKAYIEYGEDLEDVSGEVSHLGEGQWTVEAAKEMGVSAEVIEKSFQFRLKSKGNPSYTGKVLSALRNQFGGHEVNNS